MLENVSVFTKVPQTENNASYLHPSIGRGVVTGTGASSIMLNGLIIFPDRYISHFAGLKK